MDTDLVSQIESSAQEDHNNNNKNCKKRYAWKPIAAWKEIGDSAFYIFCHLESIYISKLANSQKSVKHVVQTKQFWVKYLAEFAVIVSACQCMQKRV